MADFIKFKHVNSSDFVVNVGSITKIQPSGNDRSLLSVSSHETVTVMHSLDEILQKLREVGSKVVNFEP